MNKLISFLSIALFTFFGCEKEISKENQLIMHTAELHEKIITIDTHVDTPLRLYRSGFNLGEMHDSHQGGGKLDFPRMVQGNLDAAFFAVFVGQGERTPEANEKIKKRAFAIIDSINVQLELNKDDAEFAGNVLQLKNIVSNGKRAILFGMENGYPVGSDLSLVKTFYDKGILYITLCHTKNNDICDSSDDPDGAEHNGLSEFGKEVVKEMNRLGMMIDISHVSDKSFYDVIELTEAPVIASHSCTRALRDHPRNMTDEMIKTLAKNGGVIQIAFYSDYIKKTKPNPQRDSARQALRDKYNNFKDLSDEEHAAASNEWIEIDRIYQKDLATVSELVDHIDHVANLVGIDHVGLGSDFDGGGELEDCYDVTAIGNVTHELVKRGYSDKEIEKIWGGNLMRVFTNVEQVAVK
ncbi:MAG: membrane dipeptidase [Ignavibacteriae bacterium]|nr:membrane dipeptidase [Ignavibacteriota bacterium]NOG99911.1 membrane dipeptidase [Ignavibacteriota bacterium]